MGGVGEADAPDRNLWALVNHITEGVAISREGVVCWASPRLGELVGRPVAELVGRRIEDLFEEADDGFPERGSDAAVACRVRGLGEVDRRVQVRRVPAGRAMGCGGSQTRASAEEEVWIIHDASRLRTTEMELFRVSQELGAQRRETALLQERCAEVDAQREELLATVSHELRTPLTVINGYIRLLLSEDAGPLNDQQRRFLQDSVKSCRRLDAFVAALLAVTREGRGVEEDELAEADVEESIRGVLAFLRPLLQERHLSVELRPGATGQRARFDPARIEQVLTNLLGNAIKYTKPGGTIEVETERLVAAGRSFVAVSVSDDGPGIAAEDRQRIFEPYVRANRREDEGGLGLGLAICRRIVEAHGGCIGVGDRPGGGSRFTFTLPALEAGEPR